MATVAPTWVARKVSSYTDLPCMSGRNSTKVRTIAMTPIKAFVSLVGTAMAPASSCARRQARAGYFINPAFL